MEVIEILLVTSPLWGYMLVDMIIYLIKRRKMNKYTPNCANNQCKCKK